MAFFAIIRDHDDSFEVLQCHINIWCLGGILGHSNFVWDVGLRLKGTVDKKVTKLYMAFPFGAEGSGIEDLHDRLIHQHTAELVFGSPVKIDGDEITYDEHPVVLGRVDTSRRIEDKCGPDYSFWEIAIAPTLAKDKELYVRIRIRIARCGSTWVWKRSLGRKNGALVDLRVSDVREAVAVEPWGSFKDRIVSIEKLNLLVIAPDFLQMRAVSPALRYMRLLESRAWENYLGQSPNLLGRRRLIIYHWRSQKGEPVDVKTPFLAFLDLSRDYGFVRPANHVRAAIFIVVMAAIVYGYGGGFARDSWSWATHFAQQNKLASIIGGAGALTIFFGIQKSWPLIRNVVRTCRAVFLAVEDWFLKSKRK
jgi:hypothetical protein